MSFENQLINGSFETGSFSPWIAMNANILNTYSHSGSRAVRLLGGAANAFITQFVPANPEERYEFLVSLSKVGTAPGPPLSLSIIYYGEAFSFLGYGLIVNLPSDRMPDVHQDQWIEIYQTTTSAPTGTTQALVVVNKLPQLGSPDVIVDDVALLSVETIPVPTGPAGPTGATGPTGPTGPTGEATDISDFAYIYNTGAQEVPIEENIEFNQNGVLAGIFHAVGADQITIGTSGIYAVWFNVLGEEPNQFALFQNDALVPGSIYGTANSSGPNTGMVIIYAEEGDVLTIKNHTSTADINLPPFTGGTQPNTNASLKILRMSELEPAPPALQVVNEADTVEQMQTAIESPELGLDLSEYETLSDEGQEMVAEFMLNNRPDLGYVTVQSVQDALDYAVQNFVDPLNIYVQAGAQNGNGSRARPFGTIEEGMDVVAENGTIRVAGNIVHLFTQFVNFYCLLEGPTSLFIEDNEVDHEDRSRSSIILTTRVDYNLVEDLLIQNNLFVNPHPIRLAVYFAGGGGGSNIPEENQIQVYTNTFNFPNGYGQRPGDVVDPEFPVGYNAQAAMFGMTLDAFDLQGNVNI